MGDTAESELKTEDSSIKIVGDGAHQLGIFGRWVIREDMRSIPPVLILPLVLASFLFCSPSFLPVFAIVFSAISSAVRTLFPAFLPLLTERQVIVAILWPVLSVDLGIYIRLAQNEDLRPTTTLPFHTGNAYHDPRWMRDIHVPTILSGPGKVLVLGATLGLLAAGIYGTTQVRPNGQGTRDKGYN